MRDHFYQLIVDALAGSAHELGNVPLDRLDWEGVSVLLSIYDATSGEEREQIIRAFGQILEEGEQSPEILAQVVQVASNLNVSQVTPSVERLQQKSIASKEPLRSAIMNFFAFRQLRTRVPAL